MHRTIPDIKVNTKSRYGTKSKGTLQQYNVIGALVHGYDDYQIVWYTSLVVIAINVILKLYLRSSLRSLMCSYKQHFIIEMFKALQN